ncbi:MAG: FAD-dependent oxidoreductase [Firmicutes bacterium]|nr:FAD-dependent oxidoreductase [Bacillota bacterium]
MQRVVVVGGGYAGCGAAIGAALRGVKVILVERLDVLLGVGALGAGLNAFNARNTIMLESMAMGGGADLFEAMESVITYRTNIPQQEHGYLYDNLKVEKAIRDVLEKAGIHVLFNSTVDRTVMRGDRLEAVRLKNGEAIEAGAFVDATGGTGPQGLCARYGNGCSMCVMRCPSYGPRISLSAKAGVKEWATPREDGLVGAMTNSTVLVRESVAPEVLRRLEEAGGWMYLPVPKGFAPDRDHLRQIRANQFLSEKTEYEDNIVCLDVGVFKMASYPYVNLQVLRSMPGFENAAFLDPLCGSKGNSVRFLANAPRDDRFQVLERPNLFCAGEKSGQLIGIIDALVTGILAGNNAARAALGEPLLEIPRTTALGEGIAWVREQIGDPQGKYKKYSFLGAGGLLDHLKDRGLYTVDRQAIRDRIGEAGLLDAYRS